MLLIKNTNNTCSLLLNDIIAIIEKRKMFFGNEEIVTHSCGLLRFGNILFIYSGGDI